jgi:hypothetical protein
MADLPPRLRVVKNEKPATPTGHGLLTCNVCRADTGVAGTSFIEIKRMPLLKGSRVVGGQKGLACLDCLSRGKVTLL